MILSDVRVPGIPKFPTFWEIPMRRAPICRQGRWRPEGAIFSGRGVDPSTNHQLPHCTSTAKFGYCELYKYSENGTRFREKEFNYGKKSRVTDKKE